MNGWLFSATTGAQIRTEDLQVTPAALATLRCETEFAGEKTLLV